MSRLAGLFFVRGGACLLGALAVAACLPEVAPVAAGPDVVEDDPTAAPPLEDARRSPVDVATLDQPAGDRASIEPVNEPVFPARERDAGASLPYDVPADDGYSDGAMGLPQDASGRDATFTDCEPVPETTFSGPATALTDWTAAWTVPLAEAYDSWTTTATDGLGNTFIANAVPWVGALPVTDAGRPHDVLLSSVDAEGTLRWVVRTVGPAPGVLVVRSMLAGGVVAVFPCDGVVTAGTIRCAPSRERYVIARFDANGVLAWAQVVTWPEFQRDTAVESDDADNLYTLDASRSDGGSPAPQVKSFDPRGHVRWVVPAAPYEGGRMSVQDGEVRFARFDQDPTGTATLYWTRRSTNGTLIARGAFPAYNSEVRVPGSGWFNRWVGWGPGGDLYIAHESTPSAEDSGYSVLQRVNPCGQVRWTRTVGGSMTHGTTTALTFDPSGNTCWFVVTTPWRPTPRPGREFCPLPASTTTLHVFSRDGTEAREVAGVTSSIERFCGTPRSAHGFFRAVLAPSSEFTAGDRSDLYVHSRALVRYVPSASAACPGREHRCGGRCTDTATSVDHCGACGRACRFAHSPGRCFAGNCLLGACDEGFADCDSDPANGCEADLRASPVHCGACGRVCNGGACAGGLCGTGAGAVAPYRSDGHEGAFAPRSDVILSAGVHHFTTVTVPAGVTVRADGAGVLEVRATGDVVIDGAIDLSGGDGESPTSPGMDLSGGGGGHTGRRGFANAGSDGAGSGGGGVGQGTYGTLVGGRTDARGGVGVAGGAGGWGYISSWCSGTRGRAATGPDGGRNVLGGIMEGGRAWGVPYDGYGGVAFTSGCSMDPLGERPQANVYTYGVPAGGGSIGRAAALDLGVFTTFRPGSGGGGGAVNLTTCGPEVPGGGGGGGGGALRVVSDTRIAIGASGSVRANGGRGGRNAGAGSGGVIYLSTPALTTARGAVVEATAGGAATAPVTGLGRVRLSVDPSRCVLAGTFNPPLRDGCSPTSNGGTPGYAYVSSWPR